MTIIEQSLLIYYTGLRRNFSRKLNRKKFRSFEFDRLITLAADEGIACLLYKNLQKTGYIQYLVPPQEEKLKSFYYQTACFNFRLVYDLKEILARANNENIQIVLLQGISLLKSLYKDIGLRPMSDIDLWILKKNYSKLIKILFDLGYKRDTLYQNTFTKGKTTLDLHTHLLGGDRIKSRKWLLLKSQKDVYQNTKTVYFEDQKALCLNKYDQIIYLCLHAIKHNVSRLIWLADINNFVADWESIDWKRLIERSKDLGQSKCIIYVFFLIHHLFDSRISPEMAQLTERTRLNFLEKRILLQKIEKGTIPFWGALILLSPSKGYIRRFYLLFETLFPPKKILKQVFEDFPNCKLWQLYLMRIVQMYGKIKVSLIK